MPTVKISNDGNVSFGEMEKVNADYHCQCGQILHIILDWPKDVTFNTSINLKNKVCPFCGAPIVFPKGEYKAVNGVLVSSMEQ